MEGHAWQRDEVGQRETTHPAATRARIGIMPLLFAFSIGQKGLNKLYRNGGGPL